MAGDCLKGIYLLNLIVCIKAAFQVLLRTLAIANYAKV